jgi:hypothetical protein
MDRVTICNMALEAFGQNPIASLDEDSIDTDEARLCFTFLDPSITAALEDAAPLFATDLIDLGARQDSAYGLLIAGGTSTPDAPFLPAKFALPATVLRPLRCDDGSGEFAIRWQRSKRFVICEETDKLICECVNYTDDLRDPNMWTPNFQFAVSYKLASVICGPITHSPTIKKEMLEEYERAFKKADNLDGMASTTNSTFRASQGSSLASRRF